METGRIKYAGVLVVTMAFALSASFALAGPGGWGPGMGPGFGLYPYAASATPEQSEELRVQQEAYLKEITPLQNDLFSKKMELRLLWAQANPDQKKIMAKQREINELRQELQEITTQHQFEIRKILRD
jgi:Spy/CpxP family protein refolding chaperone